jgi:hypothetical protein
MLSLTLLRLSGHHFKRCPARARLFSTFRGRQALFQWTLTLSIKTWPFTTSSLDYIPSETSRWHERWLGPAGWSLCARATWDEHHGLPASSIYSCRRQTTICLSGSRVFKPWYQLSHLHTLQATISFSPLHSCRYSRHLILNLGIDAWDREMGLHEIIVLLAVGN